MANVQGIEFHEKLSDLSECSICTEIFTNPKILPCVHTFCLHCLEKYGKHKTHGSQMNCPLCRNKFTIPDKGLSELPNNFFIGKIVEIGKLATANALEAVCEICSEKTKVARSFCIDCEQKLCDRCSNSHTKIKHCLNHRVVQLGSQLNFRELNFCNSYCEHHPKEPIKMYCHDDNVAICLICCVESHQSHRCSNVDKAAGQFTERMKDDLRIVANRRTECDAAYQKLEKFNTEFAEEVLKTEENIRRSGAELKELIDQHTEMLVQNLRVVRDRNLKCFEITMHDVGRFKEMIDSYQRYCDELMARGSPVDVCRAANQMHIRATELEKQPANCSVDDFNCDEIAFHCGNLEILMTKTGISNIVGELSVIKSSDRIIQFQKRISVNEVPVNWKTMANDEEFETVELSASDQEYQDVAASVLSTAQNTVNRIVTIERIQNKTLYRLYVNRKTTMCAANPDAHNEMTLWHGSSADTLEGIKRAGFDQRRCSYKGFFGKGVYFAKNFSYVAKNMYLKPDRSGLKYIYQCKVLTGEYVLGHLRMITPPSKPGKPYSKYDSTVDDVTNPTVFVIYCDSQACPQYLICFK